MVHIQFGQPFDFGHEVRTLVPANLGRVRQHGADAGRAAFKVSEGGTAAAIGGDLLVVKGIGTDADRATQQWEMLCDRRVKVERVAALVVGRAVFRAGIVAGEEADFRADLRAEPACV